MLQGADDAELRIVAPAAKVSRLQWLTNEEDDARAEAQRTAESAAGAVEGEARVQAEVGDTDPVLAVEDALRTFPADEIVLVAGQATGEGWLEDERAVARIRDLGVPVRRLDLAATGERGPVPSPVREAAEGRTNRTPFFVFGSVAATVWGFAALVAVVALLLWWLL